MLKYAIFVLALTSATENASADAGCKNYQGLPAQPTAFSQAFGLIKEGTKKGEFETTEEYEQRKNSLESSNRREFLIIRSPRESEYHREFHQRLRYNADAKEMEITRYAFQNNQYDDFWWGFGSFSGLADYVDITDKNNAGSIINRTPWVFKGRYKVSNFYGATMLSNNYEFSTDGILVGRPADGKTDIFETEDSEIIARIPMLPSEALISKSLLRFGFTIQPKWPYKRSAWRVDQNPKLSNPVKVIETYRLIYAHVVCGLVIKDGIVLAAFPARTATRGIK